MIQFVRIWIPSKTRIFPDYQQLPWKSLIRLIKAHTHITVLTGSAVESAVEMAVESAVESAGSTSRSTDSIAYTGVVIEWTLPLV